MKQYWPSAATPPWFNSATKHACQVFKHCLTLVVDGFDSQRQETILNAARQIEKLQRLSIDLRRLRFQREKWLATETRAASRDPPRPDPAEGS